MTRHTGYASRRAFTILEGLTVAGVIMLLLSLTIVAATRGLRSARIASERHHISAIKIGLEQFKQEFGLPPLVDDAAGPTNGGQPVVIPARNPNVSKDMVRWTRGTDPAEEQYSVHSIPYYLMGLLDVEIASGPMTGKPMDGALGPAITRVEDDGTFAQRGAPYPAVFTGGSDARRVHKASDTEIMYLDQWGVRSGVPEAQAIRYYRWETNPTSGDPNLPAAVGVATEASPNVWVIEDVELRAAKYALVSAGPDGLIDDENHDAAVNKDNIVEVGK